MVLTDKHIRAWATFLDTDADFLLCFEDDAVFKDDSVQRLAGLLDRLVRKNPHGSHLVYVDLAGGLSREALRVDELQTGKDDSFRYYRKPVTNTTCVYLMSRSLVSVFHEMLTRRPWLRVIGIDWMINALFMLMEKANLQCECMHADPTIFRHGSVTGEYMSSTR